MENNKEQEEAYEKALKKTKILEEFIEEMLYTDKEIEQRRKKKRDLEQLNKIYIN